jgi:hypothetical protein
MCAIKDRSKCWRKTTIRICLLLTILLLPNYIFAETFWVDENGTATWNVCRGQVPLDGTSACSVDTMLEGSISPGDIIYFRGGTYLFPSKTAITFTSLIGSEENIVVFTNYNDEYVEFEAPYGNPNQWSLVLNTCSYLKFNGITFTNFSRGVLIRASSHHIELAHCTFRNVTSPYRGGQVGIFESCIGGASYHCPCSHIWIHHCKISRLAAGGGCSSAISEGGDPLRIGYYSHTCGTGLTTSTTQNSIGIGEKTFIVKTGLPLVVGHKVRIQSGSNFMISRIVSYADTTLVADATQDSCKACMTSGSGTFSDWAIGTCASGENSNITIENNTIEYGGHTTFDSYAIKSVVRNNTSHNEPWYPADNGTCTVNHEPDYINDNYDGLYSHRNFSITDTHDRERSYNLYENNRIGHPGINPNNDGSTNLVIAAPGNIVRYNYLYNAMHNNMKTKYGDNYGWQESGGTRNRIYNNTLYKNGYGYKEYEDSYPWPMALKGFRYYASKDSAGNVLKNNIVYKSYAGDHGTDDIQDDTSNPASIEENNWCTNDGYSCVGSGDPMFVNPDISDPTNTTLPNLSLLPESPCIDQGTHLTQASGAGSASTTLIVNDASYFQDGSWGSSQSAIQADSISIGSVANTAEIAAIDYKTNTIELVNPMTWADDARIWLYKNSNGTVVLEGTAPDIGAYEFGKLGLAPKPPSMLSIKN